MTLAVGSRRMGSWRAGQTPPTDVHEAICHFWRVMRLKHELVNALQMREWRLLCILGVFVFFITATTGLVGEDELGPLHMMWTTDALTFESRHLMVLKSYFRYHPELPVKLYISDTRNWRLWSAQFRALLRQGYSLELIPITRQFLIDLTIDGSCGDAAELWVGGIEQNQRGPYYYSHLTDLLRFCLLWKDGGIYSDFDAVLLRPFPLNLWLKGDETVSLVIGKDRIGRGETCGWCLAGGRHYLAPGLMLAKKGAPVLLEALETAFANYDPNTFNGAGPRAITIASKAAPKNSIIVLEPELFYPLNYKEANKLFKKIPPSLPDEDAQSLLEWIERRAISLHFFGAQTKMMPIEGGSVMDMIRRDMNGDAESPWRAPKYIQSVTTGDLGIRWDGESSPQYVRLSVHGEIITECREPVIARLNECLSRATIGGRSGAPVSELLVESPRLLPMRIPIYNLSLLLTITVKTMDRLHKVLPLVDSLHQKYPHESIQVIVSNDGQHAFAINEGPHRGFTYLPLEFDVGLSAARNMMLRRITTPLVMILDDDFEFPPDGDLYYLVHQIMRHDLDIAAATSPSDRSIHGIDYSGLMQLVKEEKQATLSIVEGKYERLEGSTCDRVDIVPNIFIGRTESLRDFGGWDVNLKLGEHEDFFLRAKGKGARVASCRSVSLLHKQDKHWLKKTPYDRMRARVWGYLQQALMKHGLRSLKVFGMITMAIQPIDPADISNLRIYDLQPFAVAFDWVSRSAYHLYQVDVYDITDCTDDVSPGELYLTTYVEASSPAQPVAPSHAQVSGLDPDRYYRLVLRPGNHTHIQPAKEGCPELIIYTPNFWTNNRVINGDFAGDDQYWEGTLGAHYALVAVQQCSGDTSRDRCIPARRGHFTEALLNASPIGDFVASLYIPLREGGGIRPYEEDGNPADYGILQWIPGSELVPDSPAALAYQLSVSAWCWVDRLFGPPSQVSVRLMVKVRWSDGGVQSWWEGWDPYEEAKWQPLAFSVGLVVNGNGEGCRLLGVEAIAWMKAPGGSVFFDDFYVAARPIDPLKGAYL